MSKPVEPTERAALFIDWVREERNRWEILDAHGQAMAVRNPSVGLGPDDLEGAADMMMTVLRFENKREATGYVHNVSMEYGIQRLLGEVEP